MYKQQAEVEQQHDNYNYNQLFSSPIQGIQLSGSRRPNNGSPSQMTIQFCHSGSFRKIIEKENEDQSQNQHEGEYKLQLQHQHQHQYQNLYGHRHAHQHQHEHEHQLCDHHGSAICQFKTFDENLDEVPPILQDKQNDIPSISHLQTPLKNKQLRSPLKDITPSITKRKKKGNNLNMQTINEKYTYLTPRTMAESRFSSSSGLRRIQRL